METKVKAMVDFKNMRFSAPQVVSLFINVAGLIYIGATVKIKLDTLIEVYKGDKEENKQLHKDQASETRSIMMELASHGTRITLTEQKISQLELNKK